MSIRPFKDHIVVEKIDTTNKTPGGIELPEENAFAQVVFKVVAVNTADVKIGDSLIINGELIAVFDEGKTYYIITEEAIIGIIK